MYDEKMIEDSLAFAEEIRARLEGKKTGESSASVPVHKASPQGQTESQTRPVHPGTISQSRPVQRTSSQGGAVQQGNVQPAGQRVASGQAHPAQPVMTGQVRPLQQPAAGQTRPVQPGTISQSRPVQRTSSQGEAAQQGNVQPAGQRVVSGQAHPSQPVMTGQVRPSQQPAAGQAHLAQTKAVSQSRPVQHTSSQGNSVQQGNVQPAGQRIVQGQVRSPQQPTEGVNRPVQPVASQQPTEGVNRPAQQVASQQPAAGGNRPSQQVASQQPAEGVNRPLQQVAPQQPTVGVNRPVQPVASQQPAEGVNRPLQQVAPQQPAEGVNKTSQPVTAQQSGLPEGQITRQSMPDQTPLKSAEVKAAAGSQQPELLQAEVPKPEQPRKEHLISVSTSTSRPVRPKSSALETISEETKPMDGQQDENHTVEITIKLDVAGIKKKFSDIKKKLAPEERTLEEVNAAMEENRQLQAEKQQEKSETAAEKGAELAHKAASTASGIGKKVSGFLRKKHETAATMEGEAVEAGEMYDPADGEAVDARIVQLEGEAVEQNRFSEKLQDMKEAIPQKAGKASHLLTNIVIIAFCIGIAYFLASFVTNYVAYQTPVEGESMEPTLTDGDSVVIQRLSYYFTDPKRYDVVVFPVNYDSGSAEKTYYIKRVIGLPGETVQIIDGSVYINNEKLTDDKYSSTTINEAGIAENPLVLGENQYFVMGDNRNMSTDSRNSYVGLVNKNDIVGEAWICTWPLNHFGGLK